MSAAAEKAAQDIVELKSKLEAEKAEKTQLDQATTNYFESAQPRNRISLSRRIAKKYDFQDSETMSRVDGFMIVFRIRNETEAR